MGEVWLCTGELLLQAQISYRNKFPLFSDSCWKWTLHNLDLPPLESAWNFKNVLTISDTDVTHPEALGGGEERHVSRREYPSFLPIVEVTDSLLWQAGKCYPHPPITAFTAIPHLFERDAFVIWDAGFMWQGEKGGLVEPETPKIRRPVRVRSPSTEAWLCDSLCHVEEFSRPLCIPLQMTLH